MGVTLPDMTVGNTEKDSAEFGLNMAKFIESEWFYGNKPAYGERAQFYKELRDHYSGTVDVSDRKDKFIKNKDASTIGIDFTYQSQMPAIVNSALSGFSHNMFVTTFKGVDMNSQAERTNFRRQARKNMYGGDAAAKISEALQIDLMPKGYTPSSEEMLNLYMEMDYKPQNEVAAEIGVNAVYDVNNYDHIHRDLAIDGLLGGEFVAACHYDSEKGINIRYVPPERYITNRDTTNTSDNRGGIYHGEVMRVTISDIAKIAGGALTEDQLKELDDITGTSAGTMVEDYDATFNRVKDLDVEIFYFTFKTTRNRKYKKKYNKHGGYHYIRKNDDYELPVESRSTIFNSPYEVWYEGILVPNTNILLQYGLVDSMMRDPKNNRKAMPSYIYFKSKSESLGSRIMSKSDEIYSTTLKIRQLIQKIVPKGVAIDISVFKDIQMKNGQVLTVQQQYDIYMEDGNLLYEGRDLIDDDGLVQRPPIQDIPSSVDNGISQLMGYRESLRRELDILTGIDAVARGGAPSSRTSSDVYRGVLNAAKDSISDVYFGMMSVQKRLSEVILSRLQNASVYKNSRQFVENLLGEYTTDILAGVDKLKHSYFVLNVELLPTQEQKAKLSEDLQIALQAGTISASDKTEVEDVRNITFAKRLLRIKEKENLDRKAKEAADERNARMAEIQAKSQAQKEDIEFKARVEASVRMQELSAKGQIEMALKRADMSIESLKGQWAYTIANAGASNKWDLEKYKETAKDNRSRQEATQQGEILDRKDKGAAPKDFTLENAPNVVPNIEMPEAPNVAIENNENL